MASIATGNKTMLFGDMKKFYVRKVGAPSLYVARERFAPDYGILGFIRFDGVLANTAAIKHLVQA
jgi:HK97 family phage major capsid protein